MEQPLITIGFDKGEAEFGIRGDLADLSFDRMQELRAMIPVAIAQAEIMWRDVQSQKPENQASQEKTFPFTPLGPAEAGYAQKL
jgi:hypothetical protein